MRLITLLFTNPIAFFVLAIPLLYSVIAHEVAHGLVAYLFGDDTAKRSGRLSPNPIVHLDPAGTLMLFLVGFGWAKPVPVNFARLRPFRAGLIFVSLAGCVTNILIATLGVFLLQFVNSSTNALVATMLVVMIKINIILGAFNLIPIPPLDGSKVLMGFLPARAAQSFARLEPYGFPILIVLLFTGVLSPVIVFVQKVIFSTISAVLGLL